MKTVYLTVKFRDETTGKSTYEPLNREGNFHSPNELLIAFQDTKQANKWIHDQQEHHRNFMICSVEEIWDDTILMKRVITNL